MGRGAHQSVINALERLIDIQQIHVDPPKRRPIVRERPIADRRPGNRRKPAIEHGKLRRQRGQHRQVALLEVIQNLVGMRDVLLLVVITLHKPLHIRHAIRARIATKDLQIDGRKMMVGIGIKLPLKLG